MVAPAGYAALLGPAREEVRAAIVEALTPYRTPSGGYRVENPFHSICGGPRLIGFARSRIATRPPTQQAPRPSSLA